MVAGIAVDDVERVDLAEVMFERVGGVNIRHARIESAAEQRGESCVLELVLVSPLPVVFKLRHIARLVVCGVDVMHASFEAGVHDGEILVGQRHIDHDIRLEALQQLHEFRHVVRIHASGLNRTLQLGGDAVALRLRARGEHDLPEHVGQLRAFMSDHAADAARSDDENPMGHSALE